MTTYKSVYDLINNYNIKIRAISDVDKKDNFITSFVNNDIKAYLNKDERCKDYDFGIKDCAKGQIDILSKILNVAEGILKKSLPTPNKIKDLENLKKLLMRMEESAITGVHDLKKLNQMFISHYSKYIATYNLDVDSYPTNQISNTSVHKILEEMLKTLKPKRSRSSSDSASPEHKKNNTQQTGGKNKVITGPRGGKYIEKLIDGISKKMYIS